MDGFQKILCLLIPILYFTQPASAQVDLIYNGPFEVAGYQGSASFDFRILQSDSVFHGNFIMQKTDLKRLISSEDKTFYFKGRFKDDIPIGNWSLKFGAYKLGDSTVVNGYTYEVQVNGLQHEATGNMSDGKPDGRWLHIVNDIKNSKIVSTRFKSEITFEKGIPQRSFRLEDQDYILVGRFLRDGHAHDLWELYSTQNSASQEQWYFSDGVLNKIIINNDEGSDTLMVFDNGIQNTALVNLDNRYLNVINLRNKILNHSKGSLNSDIKILLDENAQYYQRINDIISGLGKSEFMPEFKVKLEHMPLSDQELTAINSIINTYEKADVISKSLLESSQLNILKLADEDVLFLMSALEKIDNDYLKVIGSIIDFKNNSILEYIPREGIIPGLIDPKAEIEVTYAMGDNTLTKGFLGAERNKYTFNSGGLSEVAKLAEYTYHCVDSIQNALDKRLKIEEREQRLIEIEEQLIFQFKALNQSIDSLQLNTTGSYSSALKGIRAAAKEELSAYSAKPGLDGKAVEASMLTRCFLHMDSLAIAIAKQPQQWEVIKEKYTDQVWNPFTSTVMDEELKVNITKAYRDVLMPYILNQAANITCENVPALERFITSANQRMVEMLGEETAQVERKLRKEKDVDAVISLFKIPVEVKSNDD